MVDWGQAVLIFILGISTVFLVLIILWAILALMKVVFYKPQQENNAVKSTETNTSAANTVKYEKKMSTPKRVATAPPAKEDELVALLSSAIVAYSGNTNLRVKSYKKM